MSEKQTRCPKCLTVYKVSLTQLTVAQGMVCCPKCDLNFNALTNLILAEDHSASSIQYSALNQCAISPSALQYSSFNVLDIFDRRIENSNIDLRTYLNSLNQFNLDPLTNIPSLNLSAGQAHGHTYSQQERFEARKPLYYFCWSLINIALLLVLVFQILWFNPALLDKHPALHSAFNNRILISEY